MPDDVAARSPVNQQHQRTARRIGAIAGALALVAVGALAGFAAQHANAIAEEPGLFVAAALFMIAALLTFLTSRYTVLACTDFRPREGLIELDDRSMLRVHFHPSTTMADHYIAHVRQLGRMMPLEMAAIRPVTLRRLNALSRHHVLVVGEHVIAARDAVNNNLQLGWNDL